MGIIILTIITLAFCGYGIYIYLNHKKTVHALAKEASELERKLENAEAELARQYRLNVIAGIYK